MRSTGKKLIAVLAVVSMTVSIMPADGHAALHSNLNQQQTAKIVQDVTKRNQGVSPVTEKKQAAESEGVSFSKESGTYGEAFDLQLETTDSAAAIYYTMDGSDPSDPANTGRILYDGQGIRITDRKGEENVLSAIDPILFDAVNVTASEDEKGFASSVKAPDNDAVDKCTVIKATAQSTDGTCTGVVTNTYFVGSMADHIDGISESCKAAGKDLAVMSISMDADDLFDSTKGIYVKGDIFQKALEDYLADNERIDSQNASGICRKLDANYKQKGKDWERKTHIDYFESDGSSTKCKLQQDCGIRIQGNYSRSDYQKSFRLFAREDYGKKNFKYAFWDNALDDEGKVIDKYKKIVLRNGGNCAFTTKFSDSYWQSLIENISCDNQSARPCVVYLNGEYWGVYILQDDFCGAYMENKHGIDKDNVIIYKGDAEAIQPLGYKLDEGEIPEGETENYYFKDLESFMGSHTDLSDQADYDAFTAMVDEDSMIDYFATEVWINNKWDWPGKNWSMWKCKIKDDSNSYADGKWRFLVYDVEFGGISGESDRKGNAVKEAKLLKTGTAEEGKTNYDKPHVRCFALLMTNKGFRDKFIERLESFSSGMFGYDRAIGRADLFQGTYQPILQQFFDRFPTNSGMTAEKAIKGNNGDIYGTLQAIRDFLKGRNQQITRISNYIRNYYGDSIPATATPSPEVTQTPEIPATQQPGGPVATQEAPAAVQPSSQPAGTTQPSDVPATDKPLNTKKPAGKQYETEAGGSRYLVKKDGTLCYLGSNTKVTNQTEIVIPAVQKINGRSMIVSEIGKNACKDLKKLKKVTIGKNVTVIGENAFRGCKNLKQIAIRTKKLKQVGKNAVKGIASKARIICPGEKKKAYQKLFGSKTGYLKKSMKMK